MSTATSPGPGPVSGTEAESGAGPVSGAAAVSGAGSVLGTAAAPGSVMPWLAGRPLEGPQVPPEWLTYYQPAKPDVITRFAQRLWTRSPVWAAPLALLVCMGGAAGYTLASHPVDAGAGEPATCLLKFTTGFVCPGCGGTRAAWYLLHGDLPAAARHHALFVFVVPFLLYLYVAWAARRLFGWRLPVLSFSPRAMITFLIVWGVWTVLRNLPWAPFTAFYV